MANETLLTAAANDQLSSVLEKGDDDLSSLSDAELRQYWSYSYGLINGLDAAFGFYQKGILSEDDFSGWRTYTCEYLATPSVLTIWDNDKASFGVDFSLFVEDECDI